MFVASFAVNALSRLEKESRDKEVMLSEKVQAESGEGGNGGLKAKLAARFKKRSEESPEKKKQLQDYTAWVNNYLRRKPGTPLVNDLRWSLSDGVIFVHLVEIVSKAQVTGVMRWPNTLDERRANTERALAFLRGDGVVLHQDACRDLMEGNVKGVMKVILAVAERYQPKSVKPRTAPEPVKTANHSSVPADTRQDLIRPYTHSQTTTKLEYGHSLSQPAQSTYPSPSHCYPPAGGTFPHITEDMYSSPIDQLPANKPPKVISGKKPGTRGRAVPLAVHGVLEEVAEEKDGSAGMGGGGGGGMVRVEERMELVGEIGTVVTGLTEFKTELLQLHAILLHNNDGVRDVGGVTMEGAGVRGESVEVKGAQEREKEKLSGEVMHLREQLQHMQDECTQVEAECTALRNMVEERNAFITTMKSEIYRKEYLNDTERAELHTQLLNKDTFIKKLETDLASCRGNLETAEGELGSLRGDLQQTQKESQAVLEQLREELAKVSANEEKLTQRLSGKEKKLVSSEEKLIEERERNSHKLQQLSEELEALSEGLANLTAESAQSDQLEALQRTVVDMSTRLSSDKLPPNSPGRRRRHRDRDRESEDHSRHRRKHRDRHIAQTTEPHPPPPPSPNSTRILYYMAGDRAEAPFVAIVPKKASDVTLKDFKAVFGRHGDHRFFFKTEDPDCGVVKEEITGDEHLLPNLKGKITAWIRESDTTTALTS